MTMFRTTILSLVLLQTSQSLSLGRINPAGQDASGSDYPPILTEESFGMNLARHQTPEYSDEVTQKSRDAQFMASSFVFSDSGQGSFQSRGASMTLDDSHCPADRPCTAADVEYRSVDGACNNLLNPHWGRAGLPFRRLLPRKHSLIGCGAASNQLPNPRLLSRLLVHRGDFDIHHEISMVTMVWGQVIDHDIEITPPRKTSEGDFLDCCAPENLSASDCCSILAPENDPFYGRGGRPLCMPFLRSRLSFPTKPNCVRGADIENSNTAWIDGSFIYGSDNERSNKLRSFKDGLLRTSVDKRNRVFPPISLKDGVKMEFGDTRGDVHTGFTMITTAFLRNHNLIAGKLKSRHSHWTDERLFQEARKINVALVQHVTYTEFLDALLGTPNDVCVAKDTLHENFYDRAMDGTIDMGFSTAGYRLHTLISDSLECRNKDYKLTDKLQLREVFHNPLSLLANETYDDITRGMCMQPLREFNNVFSHEMTEWLFMEKEKNFGMDIVALNVQRGRDHMIPGYPAYREHCGLGKADTWREMGDLIPSDIVHRLLHTYRKPDDVDLYIGGNMEAPVVGSMLGPTNHCLVRNQFRRLRNGDRFFYTNPGQFSESQLRSIKSQSLASILCANADNPGSLTLPENMFRVSSAHHKLTCSRHPQLNFNAWL